MLVKKSEAYKRKEIDLMGPDGNAFALLAIAKRWMNQIDPDRTDELLRRMRSGDYFLLVAIFEITFGMICDLRMSESLLKDVENKIKELQETGFIALDLGELGFELE